VGRCRSWSRSTCRLAASTRCCARRKSSPSNSDYKYDARVSSYDQFAFDISCGMAFVHGLPQPIMHRDLKAANVLVSDKLVAKVVSLCVVCVCNARRTSVRASYVMPRSADHRCAMDPLRATRTRRAWLARQRGPLRRCYMHVHTHSRFCRASALRSAATCTGESHTTILTSAWVSPCGRLAPARCPTWYGLPLLTGLHFDFLFHFLAFTINCCPASHRRTHLTCARRSCVAGVRPLPHATLVSVSSW
jgi:hypothetical protein